VPSPANGSEISGYFNSKDASDHAAVTSWLMSAPPKRHTLSSHASQRCPQIEKQPQLVLYHPKSPLMHWAASHSDRSRTQSCGQTSGTQPFRAKAGPSVLPFTRLQQRLQLWPGSWRPTVGTSWIACTSKTKETLAKSVEAEMHWKQQQIPLITGYLGNSITAASKPFLGHWVKQEVVGKWLTSQEFREQI